MHEEIQIFHLPGDLPAIASRSGEAGGFRQMKGVSPLSAIDLTKNIEELEFFTEQINREVRWINLRRRRTSNLPIRGISREWAKILFSATSESLW